MPRNSGSKKTGFVHTDQKHHPILDWKYWKKLAEKIELPHEKPVSKADCPTNFHVPQYSGVLHRYFDWQFGTRDSKAIKAQFPNLDVCEFCYYVNSPVTKIGSAYLEVQSGWDPRVWIDADEALAGQWRLIGTLYGIELIHRPGKHFLDDPFEEKYVFFSSDNRLASIDLPGDPGHLVLFTGAAPDQACGYLIGG